MNEATKNAILDIYIQDQVKNGLTVFGLLKIAELAAACKHVPAALGRSRFATMLHQNLKNPEGETAVACRIIQARNKRRERDRYTLSVFDRNFGHLVRHG